MKVVAWSQNLDPDVAKKAHAKAVSKEELFSSSDVVTVHYKLSPRSVGLVGAAELALMKPSAYLVNTSRGPLVDSAALLAALRSGSIAGAALDVYDVEPLPLSDPLRSAPNVVLTPHLGYVTEETYQVFYGDAAEDIVAFAQGSPVRVLCHASVYDCSASSCTGRGRTGSGRVRRPSRLRRFDGVGEALVLAEEFGLGLDDVLQGRGRLSSAANSWPVALATSQPCRAISMRSIAPTSAAGVASPMTPSSPAQAFGSCHALTALPICRA